MNAEKTGRLIHDLRTEKGMTQQGLAEALNVSSTAVSKWENGHSLPDISLLESLSDTLGITISEIVVGERKVLEIFLPEKDTPDEQSAMDAMDNKNKADVDIAIKSVIKESIRQRRKSIIRSIVFVLIIGGILFAAFYVLCVHGLPAAQDSITVSTNIEREEQDDAVWVIRFKSKAGHGLYVKSEQASDHSAIILHVYETLTQNAQSDIFSWGCIGLDPDVIAEDFDQTIRVIFCDGEITYSMREEGLYDEK